LKHKLPTPQKMILNGFGKLVHSGLTNKKLRVREDAFLPGRNTLLLLVAGSFAYQVKCNNMAIGLLTNKFKLFPDQSTELLI
jgi:7-cyano-7-deazaguanine synthase